MRNKRIIWLDWSLFKVCNFLEEVFLQFIIRKIFLVHLKLHINRLSFSLFILWATVIKELQLYCLLNFQSSSWIKSERSFKHFGYLLSHLRKHLRKFLTLTAIHFPKIIFSILVSKEVHFLLRGFPYCRENHGQLIVSALRIPIYRFMLFHTFVDHTQGIGRNRVAVFSWEKWKAVQSITANTFLHFKQLSKDASYWPHINWPVISLLKKNHFRSSIPSCRNS